MNCGKSSALIQVAHNYQEQGKEVLLLKPKSDTKGNNKVTSRIGISKDVDFLIKSRDNLESIVKSAKTKNLACILVDEVQFLTPKQIDQLMHVTVNEDIPVICYGLRTDFRTNPFAGSSRLLQIAHSIEELKTICRCGKKALFNSRKVDGKFTTKGDQLAIDGVGEVTYESLCPKCYYKLTKK